MAKEFIYNKELNYCTFSPDRIFGVYINYGCYLHDRHYRNERKVRLTRLESDRLLRDWIYRDLRNSNAQFQIRFTWKKKGIDKLLFKSDRKIFIKLRKLIAHPTSRVYYYAVRWGAKIAWVK